MKRFHQIVDKNRLKNRIYISNEGNPDIHKKMYVILMKI